MFERLMRVRKKVVFVKMKGIIGLCEPWHGGRIYIDIQHARRVSPSQVYLHELLHTVYRQKSEEWVLKQERRLWRKLTPHERYRLYAKLFRHPYKETP